MTKQIAQALAAPFEEKDLKHRPGRAGMTFTYADARAVAQRLDDTLGIEGWQFEVKVADAARNVVHGSLAVVIGGKTTIRQDFGYPNSAQDDEPLKSAASDALRRCAAQIGVGRSLYSPEKGTQAPVRAAAPVTGPQACSHGEAWSLKPGGISKASGKPYNPFWAASHKAPDGSWCKEKPSIKWIASQKAEPAPTKLVPEDDLEALPF